MAFLTIDQLAQHVQELPSLPDTTVRVLKMTDDPAASARDVSGAISTDMALTSKVLKIANSAYYGMPRAVSTVNEAVLILGMSALRNLALAASTYDMLRQECAGYRMPVGELWRHSLTCATAAQIIARSTRAARAEEAFVAGLLHDVGKVVLNVHIAHQFQTIIALAELDDMSFHDAEKLVLGFDHADVGAKVAEKWNLPAPLCQAICGHHCLENGKDSMNLTAIVHVANSISRSDYSDLSGRPNEIALNPVAMSMLKLNDDTLHNLHEELVVHMTKVGSTFE